MLKTLLAIIVTATIDSTTIFIGDQTDLHLQATLAETETVQMPVYGETLIPGIEIVDRTETDSTRLKDGRLQLSQSLTITSFKDSLFYISPIAFAMGDDTIYSDPLSLNVVQPFEVDTALAITPIKDIVAPKFPWKSFILWSLLGLLIIGLIIAGIWAYKKWGYLLRKEEQPVIDNTPSRPAEEIALERLDLIKEQKIWQDGRTKDYHTELTDVIREYISRRFNVCSSEKTSDETLTAMKPILADQKDLFLNLKQMLQLADLVKFAKWNTTPDENESSLATAYHFVHETTPVENTTDTPADEATTTNS